MAEKKSEIRIKAPCSIASLKTAILVYHNYPELQNEQLRELFGHDFASSTLARYKKIIRDRQRELGIKTAVPYSVNTKVAFEVFGIDITEIEKSMAKLQKLGLTG